MKFRLYLVFSILIVALMGYGNFSGHVLQDRISGEESFEPDGKGGQRRSGPGGAFFFFHK